MLSKYLPLFPDQASSMAGQVDALYAFLVAITVFFSVLVAALVVVFAIKYRKGSNPVATQIEGSVPLEILWTAIPLGIAMIIFVWSATIYFNLQRSPKDAMEIYVVGKQWMWKVQHPTGPREINQLHVPVGRNVRLTMISQDVIHSFYVPAFRIKQDVLPGRYTTTWFQATKTGTYHLFCAEYCGTAHSGMVGEVIVMEPAAYYQWLSGAGPGGGGESLAAAGEKLFTNYGCITCHSGLPGAIAPNLNGVFGTPQKLEDGNTVIADESYVRESILNPQAKVVKGFRPVMPTFSGQVSEEALIQLVAYVKSLGPKTQPAAGQPNTTTPAPQQGAQKPGTQTK